MCENKLQIYFQQKHDSIQGISSWIVAPLYKLKYQIF